MTCIELVWRNLEARGPDVEVLLFIPTAIAVESKRTLYATLNSLDQIIGYATSSLYDAVIVRVMEPPSKDELQRAQVLLRYGVGIVVGEDEYAPLGYRDQIIERAVLKMNGDPLELYRGMAGRVNIVERSFSDLEDALKASSYRRRYFY